jgi:hypothetical protein
MYDWFMFGWLSNLFEPIKHIFVAVAISLGIASAPAQEIQTTPVPQPEQIVFAATSSLTHIATTTPEANSPPPSSPPPAPQKQTNVQTTKTTVTNAVTTPPPTPPVTPEPIKTYLLPNGSIVDGDGNVIKAASPPAPTPTPSPAPVTPPPTPAPTPAPLPTPKYSVEYQSFLVEYPHDAELVHTLKWRLKSNSANSPDVIKVVSRVFGVMAENQNVQGLASWIPGSNNGFSNSFIAINDINGLAYLGAAQASGKDIVIFETAKYQLAIPANNVSSELNLRLRLRNPLSYSGTAQLSNMYLSSVTIYTTDGNSYEADL